MIPCIRNVGREALQRIWILCNLFLEAGYYPLSSSGFGYYLISSLGSWILLTLFLPGPRGEYILYSRFWGFLLQSALCAPHISGVGGLFQDFDGEGGFHGGWKKMAGGEI